MNDNLIDSHAARASWIARAHAMVMELQQMEQEISIAMLQRPKAKHALALMSADVQLGEAATAITEAIRRIERLRQ